MASFLWPCAKNRGEKSSNEDILALRRPSCAWFCGTGSDARKWGDGAAQNGEWDGSVWDRGTPWAGRRQLQSGLKRRNKCEAGKSLIHQNSTAAKSWERSSQKVELNYTLQGLRRRWRVTSEVCAWHWLREDGRRVRETREQEERVSAQECRVLLGIMCPVYNAECIMCSRA